MEKTQERKPHTPRRPAPLHVASAVVLICMDWLVFAANLLFTVREVVTITVVGAALCAAIVLGIERARGPELQRLAGEKALAAGIAVALPMPVFGSVIGAVALIWALIASTPHHRPRARI